MLCRRLDCHWCFLSGSACLCCRHSVYLYCIRRYKGNYWQTIEHLCLIRWNIGIRMVKVANWELGRSFRMLLFDDQTSIVEDQKTRRKVKPGRDEALLASNVRNCLAWRRGVVIGVAQDGVTSREWFEAQQPCIASHSQAIQSHGNSMDVSLTLMFQTLVSF